MTGLDWTDAVNGLESNIFLLAPQSGAHTIAPHRDPNPNPSNPIPLIALEQENPEKTHDVIYF